MKKLQDHLRINNVLAKEQHGFCTNKSTTSAVISLTDEILKSFENKEYLVGVFIDLAKAFETVNHSILLGKLKHYGVRGTSLKWFTSYLSNRSQFVNFNHVFSSYLPLTHSVPQGSLLGPILFNIYINDIIKSTQNLKYVLYADDSCAYASSKNIHSLIDTINLDLIKIDKWLCANKLTLNINKSHYIIFRNRKSIPDNIVDITIQNKTLEKVTETDFLGVVLQDSLSWKNHVIQVNKKINKYCSIIYLTRNYLTKNALKTLYFSVVYPSLIYCNVVWGGTSRYLINKLIVSQKRLIRTILFRTRYAHTNNDFRDLMIFKIDDINKYFTLVFIYKSLNNLTYPQNYFHLNTEYHNFNLRNPLNIRAPRYRSKKRQSSPSYYGCSIWNSLPVELRMKPSLASFKSSLKRHLLNQYNRTGYLFVN